MTSKYLSIYYSFSHSFFLSLTSSPGYSHLTMKGFIFMSTFLLCPTFIQCMPAPTDLEPERHDLYLKDDDIYSKGEKIGEISQEDKERAIKTGNHYKGIPQGDYTTEYVFFNYLISF